MSTRQKILDIASKEIGYAESPAGSNLTKFGKWFGLDGKAWCGQFVSWVYDQAGKNLGVVDFKKGFAGCQYATNNISKWGQQVTIPISGDIVFFDWQGDGAFDHTGIFVRDLGKGYFESIEGNTSFKNNSNGGEVMKRADRKYKNAIFVRPKVLVDESK